VKVELIYEQSCPNIQSARDLLQRAFSLAQCTPDWLEWEVNRSDTPAYARDYGSPTILVNGVDVAGKLESDSAACCRVYTDTQHNLRGVPALSLVVSALTKANQSKDK